MAPRMSETSTVPTPTFTPALEPPPGVQSNPDHPASLARLADITIGICIPFVTIFFILRCYARIAIKRVWIFEDFIVTAAWAGTIAYCGIMRATMSHHGGQHGWDITPAQLHEASYWFNVASIEYGVMIGVTKLAVLWLYRRVFSPIRWSIFDMAIVTLIVLITGFYGITTFVKIFECTPREKIWNKTLPGKCVQTNLILNVSGGFNTVTDFLILLLPVHAVRQLQMDKLKQTLVVLAFTFGLWYVFLFLTKRMQVLVSDEVFETMMVACLSRTALPFSRQSASSCVSRTAATPIHLGGNPRFSYGEQQNLPPATYASASPSSRSSSGNETARPTLRIARLPLKSGDGTNRKDHPIRHRTHTLPRVSWARCLARTEMGRTSSCKTMAMM